MDKIKLILKLLSGLGIVGVALYNLIAEAYNAGQNDVVKALIDKGEKMVLKDGTELKFF